jgi:outer membrane receptor protein involved in Fe transport
MKIKKNTQVRAVYASPCKLLTTGAALLLSATITFGQAVRPAENNTDMQKDDVVALEKYEVTGSRIKRLDTETVSPVVQLTASNVEAKGFITFADAIRSLSFNNGQALTPIDAGTSFTPGISTFNLRGLGNNSSLVLVNGRRAAVYAAPGFNGFQSMFDLNSLPDTAIQSVEILKDGGSAIYGSDAVAGVMNIKLRKDYQGAQVSLEYGDFFNTSGALKSASVIAGATSGKASILVSANWYDQGMIMAKDLYYSRNADLTDIAHKANPKFGLTGGGDPYTLPYPGYDLPLSEYAYYGWFDMSSATGYPGYVGIPAVSGTNVYNGEYTATAPTNNPDQSSIEYGRNYYNFQDDTSFTDEIRNYAFYTRAQYDFTNYLTGAIEVSLTHNESKSLSAPTPATLASEQGLTIGSKMYIPKTNPYNLWANEQVDHPVSGETVFDGDIYSGGRRLVEAGPRINDVTVNAPRLLVTLGGSLPENTFFQDWTWEVGVLYSSNEIMNNNQGVVPDYKLQQALLGLVDDGKGGLMWDPSADASRRTYFNWFGLNDERFGRFLTTKNPVTYKSILESYDFRTGGPIAHLPAGDIGFSIGAEHYMQKQSVNQTELNTTGNVIGGSNGASWDASRTVDAIYAEVSVPITKWIEASAAGRYESYSDDGFQERVRPKFGVKVRPLDWLIVRTSYAQSYKAPDLAYLFASKTVTYTSSAYNDPVTNVRNQLEVHVVGDKDLKPETTDTYYAGIAIEPQRGWLKGFGATIDFFRYEQKNLLAQISDFYGYNDILAGAAIGIDPFVNMVKRDPGSAQTLLYIEDPYTNISERISQGVDIELYYKWATQRYGSFRVGLEGTYTDKDRIDGDSILGMPTNRRFNGNVSLSWNYRDWDANLACYYIRGADYGVAVASFDSDRYPTYGLLYYEYHTKDQYILNAKVSYKGFWNTRITLGVTNLFNQRPPVDLYQATGMMAGVNYVLPAFWSIKVTKEF